MFSLTTHRPRNVDTLRAASILYGDLGTSKAYVIGLALALAGYSSVWLIAAVSLLTILIGINYSVICRCYPNGGGVYASVRKRSATISLIGAFFLIADFLVTAALSALSAFNYLGVSDPIFFSVVFIGIIGALNYFGPRHTGTMASVIAIVTVITLLVLVAFSLPHLSAAWHNIQPLQGKPLDIWRHFVGVIVALSGIEAIANTTGVMKLNRGSTMDKPHVTNISTKAIVIVVAEVAILTTFFAFIASAISNYEISGGEVNAPGYPNVRDSLLRYLAQVFVGQYFGVYAGQVFGWILSIAVTVLLLSAVNTSISGLIALQYLMAGDGELPYYFQKVNRFGVPLVALLMATIIPMFLIIIVRDIPGLATLYAVGFVGAIATNLGSTSTDFSLDVKWRERILMMIACLIMIAVEITLFIEKPHARIYVFSILALGLILRGLAREKKERQLRRVVEEAFPKKTPSPAVTYSILCPIQKESHALEVALEKSNTYGHTLHILFIREQSVISEVDRQRTSATDEIAQKIKTIVAEKGQTNLIHFYYCVSDSPIDIIIAYALRLEVKELIFDSPRPARLFQRFKGNSVSKLRKLLPNEIELFIT